MKEKLLISACLCGDNTKYNGGNNLINRLDELKEKYELYKVCPEVIGGLSTPRVPSEIINDKVINKEGQDVTTNYQKGANYALELVKKYNIKKALLKESSPSCGVHTIYDGTFSKTKIVSSGVTTRLLNEYGVIVYSEDEIDKLVNE